MFLYPHVTTYHSHLGIRITVILDLSVPTLVQDDHKIHIISIVIFTVFF